MASWTQREAQVREIENRVEQLRRSSLETEFAALLSGIGEMYQTAVQYGPNPRFPMTHVSCILTLIEKPEPARFFENEEDAWRSIEESSLPA